MVEAGFLFKCRYFMAYFMRKYKFHEIYFTIGSIFKYINQRSIK